LLKLPSKKTYNKFSVSIANKLEIKKVRFQFASALGTPTKKYRKKPDTMPTALRR